MTRHVLAGATLIAALAATLTGCAHRRAGAAAITLDDEGQARCPMQVPGTHLSSADAPGGAALTFTTAEEVGELQSRVQAMAELYNLHHARVRGPPEPPVTGALGERPRWEGAAVPHSYATVGALQAGAVLEVRADDPEDVEQLRYALRMRAWRLQRYGCEGAPLQGRR
jgi:hypothetical protein